MVKGTPQPRLGHREAQGSGPRLGRAPACLARGSDGNCLRFDVTNFHHATCAREEHCVDLASISRPEN